MLRSKLSVWLKMLLILPLLLALLLGAAIVYQQQLQRKSRDLALDVIEQVFTSGKIDPMLNSAHSSLADQMSAESWQNYLQALAPLGELNVLQHITGQAAVPLIPGISAGTASYDVELDFSRATAQAKVDLLLENGQWQITSWIISSPLTDE